MIEGGSELHPQVSCGKVWYSRSADEMETSVFTYLPIHISCCATLNNTAVPARRGLVSRAPKKSTNHPNCTKYTLLTDIAQRGDAPDAKHSPTNSLPTDKVPPADDGLQAVSPPPQA